MGYHTVASHGISVRNTMAMVLGLVYEGSYYMISSVSSDDVRAHSTGTPTAAPVNCDRGCMVVRRRVRLSDNGTPVGQILECSTCPSVASYGIVDSGIVAGNRVTIGVACYTRGSTSPRVVGAMVPFDRILSVRNIARFYRYRAGSSLTFLRMEPGVGVTKRYGDFLLSTGLLLVDRTCYRSSITVVYSTFSEGCRTSVGGDGVAFAGVYRGVGRHFRFGNGIALGSTVTSILSL